MALLGLRTVIYTVPDVDVAKKWYAEVLGNEPYFDEPFYVGFDVGGFELGLQPATDASVPGHGGTKAYWGVEDLDAEVERITGKGARIVDAPGDVGDDIRTAVLEDPFGNLFGLIFNPHFALKDGGDA